MIYQIIYIAGMMNHPMIDTEHSEPPEPWLRDVVIAAVFTGILLGLAWAVC